MEETLADLLAQYPDADCQIIRHRANIGGNSNILRCLELCETEWVWLLGDDDFAKPDAVKTILSHLAEYPASFFVNFYSAAEPYTRGQTFVTQGQSEFVTRMDHFGNVLFLSCGVYRVPALRKQLNIACQYTYSAAPHMALLLASLGETGEACFSAGQVVEWGGPLPAEQQFPNLSVMLGMATLLELSMPPDVRRALAQRILVTLVHWLPKRNIFGQLLVMAERDGDGAEARFTFDQIRARLYYYERGFWPRLTTRFYAFLLRFPRLSFALFSIPYRLLKGRAFGSLPEQSRWGRV